MRTLWLIPMIILPGCSCSGNRPVGSSNIISGNPDTDLGKIESETDLSIQDFQDVSCPVYDEPSCPQTGEGQTGIHTHCPKCPISCPETPACPTEGQIEGQSEIQTEGQIEETCPSTQEPVCFGGNAKGVDPKGNVTFELYARGQFTDGLADDGLDINDWKFIFREDADKPIWYRPGDFVPLAAMFDYWPCGGVRYIHVLYGRDRGGNTLTPKLIRLGYNENGQLTTCFTWGRTADIISSEFTVGQAELGGWAQMGQSFCSFFLGASDGLLQATNWRNSQNITELLSSHTCVQN